MSGSATPMRRSTASAARTLPCASGERTTRRRGELAVDENRHPRSLEPAVAQFERGVSVHGHTVYHRDLPEGVIRAVSFWTKHYQSGCDLAVVRERWQSLVDAVK